MSLEDKSPFGVSDGEASFLRGRNCGFNIMHMKIVRQHLKQHINSFSNACGTLLSTVTVTVMTLLTRPRLL